MRDGKVRRAVWSGWRLVDLPWIIGHEGGGTIVGAGKEVDAARLGERVVIEPNSARMDHRYANVIAADPAAPPRNTGLRPIRSDSRAHSGIAPSATTLASTPTHRIGVFFRPTVFTA